MAFHVIAHQPYVHPAIFSPAMGAGVVVHRIVFAQADDEYLVRRYIEFRSQVLGNGSGAALAELVVILGVSNRVGAPLDRYNVALDVWESAGPIRRVAACPCG